MSLVGTLTGKTIARVDTTRHIGRDAYRDWQSWTAYTLHFTDGTSETFVEANSDASDVAEVEYVSPTDLRPGDRFFDWSTGDTWHDVETVRIDGTEVYINGDEPAWDAVDQVARELRKPEPSTNA